MLGCDPRQDRSGAIRGLKLSFEERAEAHSRQFVHDRILPVRRFAQATARAAQQGAGADQISDEAITARRARRASSGKIGKENVEHTTSAERLLHSPPLYRQHNEINVSAAKP
jgi:hypothetical protein